MTCPYDLTTEQGLSDYIATTQSGRTSVKLLSGGTANYVYRCTKQDGSTSIFKHAAPYLHSNKSFAFDPTRMDYEANILTQLASKSSPFFANPPSTTVHAVQLLHYNKANKLLEIEDGGTRNLKDAYTDPDLNPSQVGEHLATWLAALHNASANTSLALKGQDSSATNNPIGIAVYRHSYRHLHLALEPFGHDAQLAHRVNTDFGSLLAADDECLCHGDFWPGNVLVRRTEAQPPSLTVVDWEMVRRGSSATDVGQFAAEAFLLDRFRGGRGLLAAFLKAYVGQRKNGEALGRAWVRRMVVHWAVHVAFWPTRVEWTDAAGTQKLVGIGVGALESVLQHDWDKVLASPLLEDVRDVFAPILERA